MTKDGAGVADLGGPLNTFLKSGKSLSSAQTLLDWVTVIVAAIGRDTAAAEACMDLLAASLAALKCSTVPLDMSDDNIDDDDPDSNNGMGDDPEDEQKDGEICPAPAEEVTGVEWTRPADVDWITVAMEEGVPNKLATKCEGATCAAPP